jgi:hypothetical protein
MPGQPRWHGWFLLALCLAYVAPYAFATVIIDTARDIHEAYGIATGQSFPTVGPIINPPNGPTFLSPLYFYILSVPLLALKSMTAVALFVGALAAAKFPLAYSIGRMYGRARLGILWAIALALPGVATYEQITFSYTNLVAAASLLSAYATARFLRSLRVRWLYCAGAASAIAVHAHPTAVVVGLLPWIALFLARRRSARIQPLHVLLALIVLPALFFLSDLFEPSTGRLKIVTRTTSMLADGLMAWKVTDPLQMLWNVAFGVPSMVLGGLFESAPVASLPGELLIGAWLATAVAGIVALLRDANAQGRRVPALVFLALLGISLFVSLTRSYVSFYMAFALLPWFALLWALGIDRLLDLRGAGRTAGMAAACLALAVSTATAGAVIYRGWDGWMETSLTTSDLKKGPQALRDTSLFPAVIRDRLAARWCGTHEPIALHGLLTGSIDLSFGMEFRMRCDDPPRIVLLGAPPDVSAVHVAGYPRHVWQHIGVRPQYEVAGYGFSEDIRVVSPAASHDLVAGDRYPPRQWHPDASERLSLAFSAPRNSVIAVVNPLGWYEHIEALHATANGMAQPAIMSADIATIACDACQGADVDWELSMSATSANWVDVVILGRER